jgi:glycerophosphoryl diester phosphodiesterase
MHCLKKHVYVWTVNEEALMRKMMKKKVDGIVTDHPDLGLSILKNR